MSEADVQLVREIYDAWERGDYSSAGWAHSEIEYLTHGTVDVSREVGLRGMNRAWSDFLSAWDDFHNIPEAFIELDDGVLVLTRFGGRSKAGGVAPVEFPGASRFTIAGGKVVRLDLYVQRDQAFADAGVEQADARPWRD